MEILSEFDTISVHKMLYGNHLYTILAASSSAVF